MTQSRGHFMLILLVLLLHQMNCVLLPKYNVYTYQLQLRYRYRMVFFISIIISSKEIVNFFLVWRIPKRRKNIQYVMKYERAISWFIQLTKWHLLSTLIGLLRRCLLPGFLHQGIYSMYYYLVYSNTLSRKNLSITMAYYV